MDAVLHRAQPGVVRVLGRLRLTDVVQHQDGGEEKPARIGHVVAGAARRRAVDRLEHRADLADVGRAGQTDRARDLRRDVRQNVAVQIRHHDHLEGLGRIGHLRRADVDDPVLFLDLGVLGTDLVEHLVEQAVGHLHDVVLGEAGHLPATVRARVVEGIAHDFLGARPRDQLEALIDLLGLPVLDAAVQVLLILAHDDQVHRRVFGGDERRIGAAGAHVGEQAERLADGDVERLEAAALRRGDRRLEEHLGPAQRLPGLRRDTCVMALGVHLLADFDRFNCKPRAGGLDDAQRRPHDLGANAVAMRDRDGNRICHDGNPR